jgi:hypothetical protein
MRTERPEPILPARNFDQTRALSTNRFKPGCLSAGPGDHQPSGETLGFRPAGAHLLYAARGAVRLGVG